MPEATAKRRVFILGNPDKAVVHDAIGQVRAFAEKYCEVVGAATGLDAAVALDAGAEFIIVLGGDGTILAVSRSLAERQIPLVGVNFGKLGYLAEFNIDELEAHLKVLLRDDTLVSERAILECCVLRDEVPCFDSLAVNDCVIQAGPPFRVIDMAVRINGDHLTTIVGDGLIVCTPMGSTAHNLSAGGPILQGGVLGIALTPLSPHSLTHRPLVVEYLAEIEIEVQRANHGTAVLFDGQVTFSLRAGDRIRVQRFPACLKLVRNPANPKWHGLVTKLHWGQSPSGA